MKANELRNYAKLVVNIGANVQKGQDVVINANVNDEYFVKYIVDESYKAGAREVVVDWSSDVITKISFKKEKQKVLEVVKDYQIERLKYRAKTLPAMIHVESSDPDALNGIDPKKMSAVRRARGKIIRPIRKEMESKYQWTIVALPSKAWAKKIFPNDTPTKAVEKLWNAILKCARAEGNAIENWNNHNKYLLEKCNKLNSLEIKELKYQSSNGTNFKIGLLDGLQFIGGGENTLSGTYYNPNIPTEECFISPDKTTMEGVVYATKPLSLDGTLIENFGFKFKNGEVIDIIGDDKAKEALQSLISIDEGAKRLGEVALVPYDSPINQTGILFNNTLFDENACCHLALGMGFEDTIKGYEKMTKEEKEAFGINDSMIHVDFMIGSSDLSIIATTKSNEEVQIFKNGTWSI